VKILLLCISSFFTLTNKLSSEWGGKFSVSLCIEQLHYSLEFHRWSPWVSELFFFIIAVSKLVVVLRHWLHFLSAELLCVVLLLVGQVSSINSAQRYINIVCVCVCVLIYTNTSHCRLFVLLETLAHYWSWFQSY